ncbi:MAG: hypothetical protein Q9180_009816, partial [Flavoplaca navasiana]
AGCNYKNNAFEEEANQAEEATNTLLDYIVGTQFFEKWKQNNWALAFGFPTMTTYYDYTSAGLPGRYFLQFQRGGIPLICDQANVCV